MKRFLALLASAAFGLAFSAQATVIGYYLSGTTGSPAAAITANGFTATQLTGLTAGDLAGIDVLWILNGNNGTPDAQVTGNQAAIANFVNAGGVLSFHDRNVAQGDDANTYLPGGAGISFTTDFGANIDIVNAVSPVTDGLTNASLDGGNFSDHGYATLASLPAGATAVFSTADPTHIVDFFYGFGAGWVYYSTIPLDFYFAGGGNDPPSTAFTTVYAPHEAAFQASLAVPEPVTLALVGIGLLGLGATRRRA